MSPIVRHKSPGPCNRHEPQRWGAVHRYSGAKSILAVNDSILSPTSKDEVWNVHHRYSLTAWDKMFQDMTLIPNKRSPQDWVMSSFFCQSEPVGCNQSLVKTYQLVEDPFTQRLIMVGYLPGWTAACIRALAWKQPIVYSFHFLSCHLCFTGTKIVFVRRDLGNSMCHRRYAAALKKTIKTETMTGCTERMWTYIFYGIYIYVQSKKQRSCAHPINRCSAQQESR